MALGSAARSYPSTKQAPEAKTGGKGIRTPGLLIANETLYQLSYTPKALNTSRLSVRTLLQFSALHTDLLHCRLGLHRTLQSSTGAFQKVGECLYRYSNGVYYARIRVEGKEIKRSLQTIDRELARRKLADFRKEQRQIDRSAGKLTLDALCDRYVQMVQRQKPKTVERKTFIVGRVKNDWPTGKLTQIAKIKPSDC